jgi:hypothetical protein
MPSGLSGVRNAPLFPSPVLTTLSKHTLVSVNVSVHVFVLVLRVPLVAGLTSACRMMSCI